MTFQTRVLIFDIYTGF